MNSIYQYSLLRYVHSRFLGEELNIGILFYFPDQKLTVFKYPKNLERLKRLYNDFPEKLVKSYLTSFDKSANNFTPQNSLLSSNRLEEILPERFIVQDSSSLVFENIQTGVQYQDNESTVRNLFNKYFAHYLESHQLPMVKHDERYIVHTFHEKIKKRDEDILHYLRGEKKVKTPKALLKAEEHWKNGKINLIKAVSFDLKEEGDILHKAAQLYGTLNLLHDELSNKNYNCDIIFSPPQDRQLNDVYKNAVEIVESANINKQTYTQGNIEAYIDRVLSEIERIPLDDESTPF